MDINFEVFNLISDGTILDYIMEDQFIDEDVMDQAGLCGERKALWRDSDTVPAAGMDVIKVPTMTQEERWMIHYNEVKSFIETYHRNPSKYVDSERGLRNWVKQQEKLMNAGALEGQRLMVCNELFGLGEKYKRVNADQ
jgi:hypothetical protein